MTHNNVTDKWLDAQAHPENYSDEELDELLFSQGEELQEDSDEKRQDVSEKIALLKRAFAYDEAKHSVDAEEEWKKLEEKLSDASDGDNPLEEKHSSFLQQSWMKIAAAFVGLLMLSGISYAAYHIASNHSANEKVMAEADSVKTSPTAKEKTAADEDWIKIEPTKHAPVIFEDAELATILKYIAEKTNVKVEYRNPSAAHVRFYLQWDNKDSLQDIIDKLNHFEKVHVFFDEANQLLIVE